MGPETCTCPQSGPQLFCPWCGKRLQSVESAGCVVCGQAPWQPASKYCQIHSPVLSRKPMDERAIVEGFLAGERKGAIAARLGIKSVSSVSCVLDRVQRGALEAYCKHLRDVLEEREYYRALNNILQEDVLEFWLAGQKEKVG